MIADAIAAVTANLVRHRSSTPDIAAQRTAQPFIHA
jgi:hypothetical protein